MVYCMLTTTPFPHAGKVLMELLVGLTLCMLVLGHYDSQESPLTVCAWSEACVVNRCRLMSKHPPPSPRA